MSFWKTGSLAILAALTALGTGLTLMLWMPGASYRATPPPLTEREIVVREELRGDIKVLTGHIGIRTIDYYENLTAAAAFLDKSLTSAGYRTQHQRYMVTGRQVANIEVEIPGNERKDEIVIIGAHYDSVRDGPGANDNGSGAAAVLALARTFVHARPARTLRFVEFVNEEQPYAQTSAMGSVVYAKRSHARSENIVAMLSLETMGYYSDEEGSQRYPSVLRWVYPSTGNFIGFVSNVSSGRLLRQALRTFRNTTPFPSEGGALPADLPGIGWSDHWAFWQQGYPAIMITDTAPFRYPHYHTAHDTPDKIDYDRLARVVVGLEKVVMDLAEK